MSLTLVWNFKNALAGLKRDLKNMNKWILSILKFLKPNLGVSANCSC